MVASKYKTIIWDWNGTLLNDIQTCIDITNGLLKNHNDLQLTKTSYQDVFGFPITAYYDRIGMNYDIESFEELTHKFIAEYNHVVLKCDLHQNVKTLLKTFEHHGIQQYILTAAHKESVVKLLDHFSLTSHFVEVEGLDNYRAESKVERGRNLLQKNKIDSNKTVLIGDTLHDFEVAKALGTDCILIANGHQSKSRLQGGTKGEILVLDSIEQLI